MMAQVSEALEAELAQVRSERDALEAELAQVNTLCEKHKEKIKVLKTASTEDHKQMMELQERLEALETAAAAGS